MKELMGAALLALVVANCSSTPMPPRHEFDYDDVVLLKKSFAEVVRKEYGSREDGTLSEPLGAGTRFLFSYHKPVDGAHIEMVDLKLGRVPRDAIGGMPTGFCNVFQVIVHRAKPGRDPILAEESARLVVEIKAMMAGEGASPSRP